jgi:hypothetical protein
MKINPIMLLITFAISALTAYGFYAWNSEEPYRLLLSTGGGFSIFIPLAGLLAVSGGGRGTVGNIRALSAVFLVLKIISNIIFGFVTLSSPALYIIVNGILLLIYLLIAYSISRALK